MKRMYEKLINDKSCAVCKNNFNDKCKDCIKNNHKNFNKISFGEFNKRNK